jgi:hypothetical protein
MSCLLSTRFKIIDRFFRFEKPWQVVAQAMFEVIRHELLVALECLGRQSWSLFEGTGEAYPPALGLCWRC